MDNLVSTSCLSDNEEREDDGSGANFVDIQDERKVLKPQMTLNYSISALTMDLLAGLSNTRAAGQNELNARNTKWYARAMEQLDPAISDNLIKSVQETPSDVSPDDQKEAVTYIRSVYECIGANLNILFGDTDRANLRRTKDDINTKIHNIKVGEIPHEALTSVRKAVTLDIIANLAAKSTHHTIKPNTEIFDWFAQHSGTEFQNFRTFVMKVDGRLSDEIRKAGLSYIGIVYQSGYPVLKRLFEEQKSPILASPEATTPTSIRKEDSQSSFGRDTTDGIPTFLSIRCMLDDRFPSENHQKTIWIDIFQQIVQFKHQVDCNNIPSSSSENTRSHLNNDATVRERTKLLKELEIARKKFVDTYGNKEEFQNDRCACYNTLQHCKFGSVIEYPQSTRGRKSFTKQRALLDLYPDSFDGYIYRIPNCIPLDKSDAGAEAEESVAEFIRMWGENQHGLHMVIISHFKYNIGNFNGDHDIVIICEEIGLIFVQVKGTKSPSLPNLRNSTQTALRQLWKDLMATSFLLNDVVLEDTDIPVWGVIALPNVVDEIRYFQTPTTVLRDNKFVPICVDHKKIILTKFHIESNSWIDLLHKQSKMKPPKWTHQDFLKIWRSFVENTTVSTKLERNCRNKAATTACLYLSPAQMNIVRETHMSLIVAGDFGTGKTNLLTHMAQNFAMQGVITYIISCAEVNKAMYFNAQFKQLPFITYLKDCIRHIHKDSVKIKSVTELYNTYLSSTVSNTDESQKVVQLTNDIFVDIIYLILNNEQRKINIFVDEMPLSLFESCKSNILNMRSNIDKLWFALRTESCYDKYIPDCDEFPVKYLTRNMRNPPVIYNLMKAICDYTGHKFQSPRADRVTDQTGNSSDDIAASNYDLDAEFQQHENEQGDIRAENEQSIPQHMRPQALLYRIENCECEMNCECRNGCKCDSALCQHLKNRIAKVINKILKDQDFCHKDTDTGIARIVFKVSHIFSRHFKSELFEEIKSHISEALKKVKFRYDFNSVANAAFPEENLDSLLCDDNIKAPENKDLIQDNDPKCKETEENQSTVKITKYQKALHLIVDENTFTGCENDRLIYIDLLSMWQWLPDNPSESASIMFLSRCTCKYAHVIFPPAETERLLREHLRTLTETSEESSYQHSYTDEVIKIEKYIKNRGSILTTLLEKKLIKEK